MTKTSSFTSAIAASAAIALVLVPSIPAEVSQEDGVRVEVTGAIAPARLPRNGTAPIGISISGHISPARGGVLPKLRRITVAFNRHGRLNGRGLPLCRLGHIDPSTTSEALAACRSSLIGEGSFSADVRIPEQSPFPSEGKVLAFNGRLKGRPTIFAHIYGTRPVPTSYVLLFSIAKREGIYGTTLEASFPQIGEWGYVTGLSLVLRRSFASGGRRRSYLTASCPAPKGFSSASFPLARTTFAFENNVTVSETLSRTCKVAG